MKNSQEDRWIIAGSFILKKLPVCRDRVEAAIEAARRRVDAAEMAAMPRCELVRLLDLIQLPCA